MGLCDCDPHVTPSQRVGFSHPCVCGLCTCALALSPRSSVLSRDVGKDVKVRRHWTSHWPKRTHHDPRRRYDGDCDCDRHCQFLSVRGLLLPEDEVTTKICVAKGRGAGEKECESPCGGGENEKGKGSNGNVLAEDLALRGRVLPVEVCKIEVRRMMGCHIIYRVGYQLKSSPHILRRAVMASEMGFP